MRKMYFCDYCGKGFEEEKNCFSHEKICPQKLINEFKEKINYRKAIYCGSCKYHKHENDDETGPYLCKLHYKTVRLFNDLYVCDWYEPYNS